MADHSNEGEGSRLAARQYNEAQRRFAESGKVKPAADDAARALDSGEGPALQEAERLGKAHAKAEDPAVKR
ncbi:MAG: hypothetical protein P4M09_06345 [Devosia sp.]|nr:hypothetical protein [Devosia sp.]